MLTAIVIPHHSATATVMQTIPLNTGFNHDPQYLQKYSPNPKDDLFWSVIQDPNGSTLHPASTINPYPVAWQAAQGDSQWISFVNDGSTGLKQGAYVYQKCFCLTRALFENKDAINQSSLDLSVMADDAFYLDVNSMPGPLGNILTNGGGKGGFGGPPATLKLTGQALVNKLKAGRNCLNVRVDDLGGVITGFNLVGTLTTTGIDGIAQAAGPKETPQFNNCSSCKKRGPFDPSTEVGPAIKVQPVKRLR
jgi:hypothetical protein